MQVETFFYKFASGWSINKFPSLDTEQTLILVFGSQEFIEHQDIISDLHKHYPNSKIVGCSTAGEIFEKDILDNSLVVAVAKFDSTTIRTSLITIADPKQSFEVGSELAQNLLSPSLKSIFVLSVGINVNGNALVQGINSKLPNKIVVTGGMAGDGARFVQTWILNNDEFYTNAAIAVGYYGDALSVSYGTGTGWDIFGPERVVTQSEGNKLYQLDGKPALKLYQDYLGELSSGLPATGLLFPLSLRLKASENRFIRGIVAIDEEENSVSFAGDVPQDSLVQLMTANHDNLVEGAIIAAEQATKEIKDNQTSLCLTVSCVGRKLLMKENTEEEVEAVLEKIPYLTKQIGFYSYGELSPQGASSCGLHNQTITLTVISEINNLKKQEFSANESQSKLTPINPSTKPINSLFRRQLKKAGILDVSNVPSTDNWLKYVENMSQYIETLEKEKKLFSRSLKLSSDEMQSLYQSLAEKVKELNKKNIELAQKNEELIQSYKKANQIFAVLAETLPGKILDGKYRLETKIGSGGYGAVYKATHLSLNYSVAVKVFLPAKGNDTVESLERFRLEGMSACRINHPNAVSVLDSGISDEGIAYLVMELLEGHTLADELKEKGTLSLNRCAEIIIPVCKALNKAHEQGIVHRDIKPDNIFLHKSKEGEVIKVVDFGLAKFVDLDNVLGLNAQLTVDAIIGTPAYLSPERINSQVYDGKADVYSVGIVMYEILCGQPPFDPSLISVGQIISMHLRVKPKSIKNFRKDIPTEVDELIMRALAKSPEKRPSVNELAKELSQYVNL